MAGIVGMAVRAGADRGAGSMGSTAAASDGSSSIASMLGLAAPSLA
jgi:hypothetical protein